MKRDISLVVIGMTAAMLLYLAWGCSMSGTRDRYRRVPSTQPSGPVAVEVERNTNTATFADWTGPSATEVASRQQGFEVDAEGGVKSRGSKWSFFDSIGTWFTKSTAFLTFGALGISLFSVIGSFLTGTGGLSGLIRGLSQGVSGLIPGVGAIVQRFLHKRTEGALSQVVQGGDAFKALLPTLGISQAQQTKLWDSFKGAQKSAQDTTTQHRVNAIRNGG